MEQTICAWAWAWMKPPMHPNGPSGAPPASSRKPGMIVWYGRRPGSTRPETSKQLARFCSTTPVPGAVTRLPKP
jgi:hypothetical protein